MLGTMNVVKSQRLSEEAISRLIDPRTGMRLRPLGVVGGRPVWPMMGASPDDPSSKERDDEDDDKETEDEKEDPEGSESDEGDKGSKGDPESKIAALEDEKNRHVRRRQEAERERDEMRRRLEALESKDKPEQEKLQSRVTELESEVDTLSTALKDSRLENAFLSDNSYSWHNPRRALALADLSEVEIDSDGTVHGLKSALDKLAKSDAYLLKTEESPKDKTKDQPSTQNPKSKSKKDKQDDKAEDKALLDKYPALRR